MLEFSRLFGFGHKYNRRSDGLYVPLEDSKGALWHRTEEQARVAMDNHARPNSSLLLISCDSPVYGSPLVKPEAAITMPCLHGILKSAIDLDSSDVYIYEDHYLAVNTSVPRVNRTYAHKDTSGALREIRALLDSNRDPFALSDTLLVVGRTGDGAGIRFSATVEQDEVDASKSLRAFVRISPNHPKGD